MKKVLILAAVMVLAVSGISYAGIAGEAHDMTTYGGTLSSCQYCHTPHGGNATITGAPIWNRTLAADGSWTLYGGGTTLNGTTVNNPGPNSKTCLSCHDGTLAVGDVLVGGSAIFGDDVTVSATTGKIITTANLGTDLRDEHPVGLTYDNTKAGLIADPTTANFKLYGAGSDQFECASCHEPHDQTTNPPFLRVAIDSICSACHVSK